MPQTTHLTTLDRSAANGVASLGANTKVPLAELPNIPAANVDVTPIPNLAGTTAQAVFASLLAEIVVLQAELDALGTTEHEAVDVAGRDALPDLVLGDRIFVQDASADATVDAGWAIYRVVSTGPNVFQKLSEQESLDVAFTSLGNANQVLTGHRLIDVGANNLSVDLDGGAFRVGDTTLDGSDRNYVFNETSFKIFDEFKAELEINGSFFLSGDALRLRANNGTLAGGTCELEIGTLANASTMKESDLNFEDGYGPALPAPDGNLWRLTVDNNGAITSVQVAPIPFRTQLSTQTG